MARMDGSSTRPRPGGIPPSGKHPGIKERTSPPAAGAPRFTSDDRRRCSTKAERRADAILDVRAGQAASDRMGGFPAGAVGGDHHVGCELFECADGVVDDRLEQRAGQMESADKRVQFADAGQALGIAADVDHPGVSATG